MSLPLRLSGLIALVAAVVGLGAARPPADERSQASLPQAGRNLALHRPYTVNRPANYSVAVDSDHTHLTDGVYTIGYFWSQSTTVGWTHTEVAPVIITVDLGTVQSVGGASYSTGAGAGGVHWPTNVYVLTSEDDSTWYLAGDLVALDRVSSPPPSPDAYGTHRYATTRLATRGRYVAFVIRSDPSVFCDEVEVLAGGAMPAQPQGGQVPSLDAIAWGDPRLQRWSDTVTQRLSRLPEAVRRGVAPAGHAEQLPATFTPTVSLGDRRARLTVPYTREQEDLLALNGRALQAGGAPPLAIWKLHRYDPLDPIQTPASGPAPALAIEVMNGERRADAIVLTNGTGEAQRVHLQVTGLPGGLNPPYVRVSEVQYVETATRVLAASALQDAEHGASDLVVTVPAGLNRQLWVSAEPTDVAAGTYQGTLRFQTERPGVAAQTIPFMLHVSSVRFPAHPRIHLGGWDYTNRSGANDISAANRDSLVRFLQSRYVDAPWATASVFGRPAAGDFGADCALRPDFAFRELDDWLARWRGARLYMIAIAARDTFAGQPAGSPQFRRCVGSWLSAVAAHLRQVEVPPSQVGLLLVDEPITDAQAARVSAWADAVHGSGTGIFVWENPLFTDPARPAAVAALEAADVICPLASQYVLLGHDVQRQFRQPGSAAKQLWFYNTAGPAHVLDPYAYYQLQFWLGFREGAEGMGFWGFSDAGGGSSWNEHASPHIVYTPEYLAPDGVTDSKQMMAIVEGVEDYEYLSMLRDALAGRDGNGADPAVRDAATLLRTAPDSVLAGEAAAARQGYAWQVQEDRAVADRMRARVLSALETISAPAKP